MFGTYRPIYECRDRLWDDVRLGHLSEKDAEIFEQFSRSSLLKEIFRLGRSCPGWRRQVYRHRARVVLNGSEHEKMGREVILKVVSTAKSRSSIRDILDYIVKPRVVSGEMQSPVMHDPFGMPLTTEAWHEEFRNWDLLSDNENVVRREKDHSDPAGACPSDATFNRQLYHVQAYHFVFSIDRRDSDPSNLNELFHRSIGAVIDEAFTGEGHQVLWALHEDAPCHPHIHAVVMARSRSGKRLRIDKSGDYFDYLRILTADRLQEVSIDCQATRRVDRSQLREDILTGRAMLQENWHTRDYKRPCAKLRIRAPRWYDELMTPLYKQNRSQGIVGQKTVQRAQNLRFHQVRQSRTESIESWLAKLDERARPAAMACVALHRQPIAVFHDVLRFVAETKGNGAFAAWLVRKHPNVFGMEGSASSKTRERRNQFANEVRKLEGLFDFEALRHKTAAYPLQKAPVKLGEEAEFLILHQRRRTIESLLRLAALSHVVLRDNHAAEVVVTELRNSLRHRMPRYPRVKRGRREVLLMQRWEGPNQKQAPSYATSANKDCLMALPRQSVGLNSSQRRRDKEW